MKRPLAVTIISWVFVATGVIGLSDYFTEIRHAPINESVWIVMVRLIALACGVYMLRGRNWARWICLLWLAYHVILSGFHSVRECVVHGVLLAVFATILFRQDASEYFHSPRIAN